ncbi:MAG: ATP-binding cassette domain-containing protein [Gammaproteobacteria bacterium]|nr:ATP-binding cassette domain-containing protein [Gammaproteobacteria bacterium]
MATSMFFLACLILGLIAVQRMPVALFPSLEGEVLTVNFSRLNSSPELLEREILNKLESRIGSIPDIRETTGQIRGSQGSLNIEFAPDTDIKIREYEVRRIATRLQREQPRNTTFIGVQTQGTSAFDTFVMDISVIGSARDTDVLFDIASDLIAPRFAAVPGVAQATASGGGGRQVIVEVDPNAAAMIGVNTSDITQAIERSTGKLRYMGNVDDANGATPVLLDGRLRNLQTLENTQITSNAPVRVSHTADVHLGYAAHESFYRVNGQRAVGITIYQEANANLVELGNTLRERVEQVRAELESMGIDLVVMQDASEQVDEQLTRITQLGLIGLAVALLALFVFLRQWRAVLVVGVSVPLSIVLALALLYLFGYGINLLTLFGLAVSTGLLVDNSVVVYEAILRGVERRVPIAEAAEKGLRRTIRAISAASLTTAVVFLPIILIDLEDTFIQEFMTIVAVSLLLPIGTSLFVAIGLVPLLAHRLAGPAAQQRAERMREVHKQRGGLVAPNFLRVVLTGFSKSALRYPASWLTGVALAVMLTIFFAWIPVLAGANNNEAQNPDSVSMNLIFDRGARSLDASVAVVARIEAELLALEGVKSVTANGNKEGAQLVVQFVDLDERPKELTAGSIRSRVWELSREIRGVDVMSPGGQEYDGKKRDARARFNDAPTARVVISGPESETLSQIAEDIENRLEGASMVAGAWVAMPRGNPELWVSPNESILDSLGLRISDVLGNLNLAGTEGVRLATEYALPSGREIPIVVERIGIRDESSALGELRKMRVNTSAGAISLESVATTRRMRPAGVIVHKNGRREMAVNYRLSRSAPDSGDALLAVRDQINAMIATVPRPPEYIIETPVENETVSTISKILLPAILFLFLVLAMTFESLTLPVLVLLALPLTMLGSGWVLFLTGKPLEPGVLVGMLALIGLTVNPAILLVDRMQRKTLDAGWSRGAAALSVMRERTRPVLLVTATTIAALAPLAVSTGRENEIWPGFAITVMGGMITAALLTLLVIPVGYILLHRLDQIFGRVGPWLMVVWIALLTAVMTWLIWAEILVSMLWQAAVALLIGGCLLAAFVMIFRKQEPPEPHMDGGPPILEVKHLSKIYGLAGPVRTALEARKAFIRRVIERGGEMFSRTDSVEKALIFVIVAAGFAAVSYLTLDDLWGLLAALGVALFIGLFTYEIRRLLGQVDDAGDVIPNGFVTLLVYALPWLAVALNVYLVNVRPTLTGDSVEVPVLWPIVVGLVLIVLQLMRRSAVKQNRGTIAQRAEGFLRYPRTFLRAWSRRIAGFDIEGREVHALTGVEFSAKRGMIGILGPNGAGKTTLLRQLAGILEPTSGVVSIGGVPIHFIRKHLARWVGYLPQDAGLPPGSTPRAYLMYYAGLYEIPVQEREERVDSLLQEVGLAEKEDETIGSLSGGMRQRVAVARTLLRLPPIIIVDEPTVGLDPRERIRFRNLLSRLAQNRIVLFSTHVVDDVAVACDRVLVLASQRLQFDGAPSDLSGYAEGKVWNLEQAEDIPFELPDDAILVNETPTGSGQVRRRILANVAPSVDAVSENANLEDGYLWLIDAATA